MFSCDRFRRTFNRMILREPEVSKFSRMVRASRIVLIFRALPYNTKLTYDFGALPQEGSRFRAKNFFGNDELQGMAFALRKRGAWIETNVLGNENHRANLSPSGNGGRGLKRFVRLQTVPSINFRPPETGGVD